MGQPRSLELLERRGAAVVRRVRIVYYLSASCSASRREGGSSACVCSIIRLLNRGVVHLAPDRRSAPRPAPAPARSTVLAVNAQDLALGDRASAPRRPRRNAHEVQLMKSPRRGGGPAGARSRGSRHTPHGDAHPSIGIAVIALRRRAPEILRSLLQLYVAVRRIARDTRACLWLWPVPVTRRRRSSRPGSGRSLFSDDSMARHGGLERPTLSHILVHVHRVELSCTGCV